MPGGFEERAQRQLLLREMDAAPRRSVRVPVPDPHYHNADNVARRGARLGFAELLAAAFVGHDPATYAEAMQSAAAEEWTQACQYEMDALAKNGTWELDRKSVV